MLNKEELEEELSKAKLKRERSYDLRERFIKGQTILRENYEKRIKRIEQQMTSVSMAEKDKAEYDKKRLNALNRYLELEDSVEICKNQINKRCEENEYEVFCLENQLTKVFDDGGLINDVQDIGMEISSSESKDIMYGEIL